MAPGGPATIRLCPGTAYSGHFLIQRNVTVVGAGPTSTVLSGSGTSRVVTVVSDVTANLQGLQLTNSRAWPGGGLMVDESATVTLHGCLVQGNTATHLGGGGFSNRGALTLIDTVMSGNSAPDGGGGMASELEDGAVTLVLRGATRIEGNQASDRGGGLWLVGGSTTVELREDSIITGNVANPADAASGGGIFNHSTSPATVVFFDRSRVTANTPNNCTGVTCPS